MDVVSSVAGDSSFNRTTLELKSVPTTFISPLLLTFNRTTLELKYETKSAVLQVVNF